MTKPLILGYCPLGNGSSIHPFDQIFDRGQDISKSIEGVDAVVFWGGTDIHPSLYNEPAHRTSQMFNSKYPSSRDDFEWRAMNYCMIHGIPMIGVCRGAQLMCAFAGGKLIQDCDKHASGGGHQIQTVDGRTMYVTSAHHQMMYPYDIPHELLAWATPKRSTYYENGLHEPVKAMETKREPEIVYFPTINGLAIQGHPEWMGKDDVVVKYFNELILEKLLLDQVEAA